MPLVVLGTLAFDAIETPFAKTDKIVGGAGLYISLAAEKFCPVKLISIIGNDFPTEVLTSLAKKNIDLTGVQKSENKKTFFWSCRYHLDMNNRDTLITQLNALEDFKPILPNLYQNCDFVLLGNVHPTIQRDIVKKFNNRPRFIALDSMNFWIENFNSELKETIALVDCLILNDSEARMLTHQISLKKAAEILINLGPKYIIIKKGEHGAILFSKDLTFYCPALPLDNVVDPTGAGDCFAGGLIGYLASCNEISAKNIKKSILYGSAIASFGIEKLGIERLNEINRQDLDLRVEEFMNLTNFH